MRDDVSQLLLEAANLRRDEVITNAPLLQLVRTGQAYQLKALDPGQLLMGFNAKSTIRVVRQMVEFVLTRFLPV
jgi:hypothetical protein